MSKPSDPQRIIAFQGVAGAYSDMACRAAYPHWATLPCASFEDTFASVRQGRAGLAMIPMTAPERQPAFPFFNDFKGIVSGPAIHDENFHRYFLLEYGGKGFIEKAALVK